MYIFSIASRPALGPTHRPIQWVPGCREQEWWGYISSPQGQLYLYISNSLGAGTMSQTDRQTDITSK
jgi:hypothetical protein